MVSQMLVAPALKLQNKSYHKVEQKFQINLLMILQQLQQLGWEHG